MKAYDELKFCPVCGKELEIHPVIARECNPCGLHSL